MNTTIMMSPDTMADALSSIRSAARMGDYEKLESLLGMWQNHSILNDRTGDIMGLTPLHWAVAAGVRTRKQCVLLLLQSGAFVDSVNSGGNTPLMYACATGKTECTQILIDYGANVNARSQTGQTPLHLTSMRGDDDTASILLSAGANVNDIDDNGDSALHFSTRYGKTSVEKILIENKADINLKNNKGQTPYDYKPAEITNLSYE